MKGTYKYESEIDFAGFIVYTYKNNSPKNYIITRHPKR